MGAITKASKRSVIPRWRSLAKSTATGELNSISNTKHEITFNSKEYLLEQQKTWAAKKSYTNASDLLSSAYVLGLEKDFTEVANYIISEGQNSSLPIHKIAEKTLGVKNDNIIFPEVKKDESSPNIVEEYSKEIAKYRFFLKQEPRNPIAWVELGRLFSLSGEIDKGQKAIDTALHLDNRNRFIVRSASRFYEHFHGGKDIALQIIKKATDVDNDPWLLSAEIAYSTLLNRFSKKVKIGKEFLNRYKDDHLSITELASAIGTVEHENGKKKEALHFFNTSLLKPNDNSLAQIEWLSLEGIYVNPVTFTKTPYAFEANAIVEYEKCNFDKSLQFCRKWKKDEPYSSSPVLLASYILGTFQQKKKDAITMLKEDLSVNRKDKALLNNLIYYLAKDNQIEAATKLFLEELENTSDTEVHNAITIMATSGLLLYRTNNPVEGKNRYMKAIEMAKKIENDHLIALAALNYISEELRISERVDEVKKFMPQLIKYCKNRNEPDVLLLKERIMKDFEKKQAKS